MIDKIHDVVLNDRRIKVREIVEAAGISQGTVFPILHEKLGVKKISARWLPRLLNAVSMAKIMELKFELLQHPPDLSPNDFFLFPNLKKWLVGQQFTSNEEVIAQWDAYFEDITKSYFLDGSKKLKKRLEKCLELKGDYVKE